MTARAFIPWSLLISTVSVLVFGWRAPNDADGDPQRGYTTAMQLVWLALFIDAFIEPLYISVVYKGDTRFEMQVEIAARTAEAFVIWLTVTTPQVRLYTANKLHELCLSNNMNLARFALPKTCDGPLVGAASS